MICQQDLHVIAQSQYSENIEILFQHWLGLQGLCILFQKRNSFFLLFRLLLFFFFKHRREKGQDGCQELLGLVPKHSEQNLSECQINIPFGDSVGLSATWEEVGKYKLPSQFLSLLCWILPTSTSGAALLASGMCDSSWPFFRPCYQEEVLWAFRFMKSSAWEPFPTPVFGPGLVCLHITLFLEGSSKSPDWFFCHPLELKCHIFSCP